MSSLHEFRCQTWYAMRSKGGGLRVATLLLVTLLAACAVSPRPEAPAATRSSSGAAAPQVEAPAVSGGQGKPPMAEKSESLPANMEESIFFSPGSSALVPSERNKLKLLAARLLTDRRQSVTLIGYAADQGSRSFNLAIVDARIGAVAKALKKQGVNAFQIRKRVGGSEVRPANCRSPECWRLMRRVDFVFPESVADD